MEQLKLGVGQRRFLVDHFKDALVNETVNGEPYFKRLGSNVQSIMRDTVQFICLHKPLKGEFK